MIAQYGAPLEAFFFIVLFGAIVVVGLFMADGLDPVNTTWRSLTTSAIIAALVVVLLDAWLGWVFFAQIVLGITAIGVGGAVLLKVFRRRHLAGWQWWTALALAAVAAIGVTAVYGPVAVNNAFQEIPLLPLGGRFSDAIALGDHPADCARFNPIAQGCTGATGLLLVDSALAGDWALFNDAAMHLVLPGITLGYASLAIIARMMRGSMLETLNQDYIRTARAKGIAEREIIREHARRNALIPVTTVIGLSFGGLLGGAVLTETIFQWQGLGLWSTNAITAGDTNSVMGFVLFVVVVYLIANLVVDIVYSFLDPRVRLG
jgi:ABC-type dipeptide/oligopeptide/nickel transport system permease component